MRPRRTSQRPAATANASPAQGTHVLDHVDVGSCANHPLCCTQRARVHIPYNSAWLSPRHP
eukprot:8212706-Alexandrium_andersonii.AAC.1